MAALAPTSSDYPGTRESGGQCDRPARARCATTNFDHRPEPAGAVRPARLAGVPGPDGGRVRRHRRLPEGQGRPAASEVLDGVTLLKYRPYAPGGGALGFVLEYAYSFLATAWLGARVLAGRASSTSLQACNPPDIFWPIARWLRRRDGSRFVFDHHDLCPELYESRFPDGARLPHRGLLALERATFRTADHVVATNDSYAEIAMGRGGKDADDVTVVRTGPTRPAAARRPPVPRCGAAGEHLVAYIGVMGPQDGVDLAVRAAATSSTSLGRDDVAFTFMGAGDCYRRARGAARRARAAGLRRVPRPGSRRTVVDVLSTADVGLSPDPKNPLNDVSTMNKTMEYMAFELPVVAFDLKETRVSAGERRGATSASGDVAAYAGAIVELLDDEPRRGGHGRDRTRPDRAGAAAGRTRRDRATIAWSTTELADVARATRPSRVPTRARADVCGVAGAFRQPDGAELVRTMIDRIGHRGPDAAGFDATVAGCAGAARRTGGCRSSTCRLRPTSRSSRTA